MRFLLKNLNLVLAIMLVFLGIGFSACSPKRQVVPVEIKSEPVKTPVLLEHTIKYSGETLGMISNWYTGEARNWKKIAAANQHLNPNRLRLGNRIVIPTELVKQSKPFSKEYVEKYLGKVAARSTGKLQSAGLNGGSLVKQDSPKELIGKTEVAPSDEMDVKSIVQIPIASSSGQSSSGKRDLNLDGELPPAAHSVAKQSGQKQSQATPSQARESQLPATVSSSALSEKGALLDEEVPSVVKGSSASRAFVPVEPTSGNNVNPMSEEDESKAKLLNELLE